MNVTGIIAEFNPFHNGHEYIIRKAKELTDADFIVIVMSGDFVQSGEPAFCDKELRTRMALSCGADLVLMLPTIVSTGSAEIFAEGAVALLDSLGCVNNICFGSEICDLSLLEKLADILANEPDSYRAEFRKELMSGKPFPAAREAALVKYVSNDDALKLTLGADMNVIHAALSSSNSILAIEYLKAIKKLRSNMVPVAIPRKKAKHHSGQLTKGDRYCSATALRKFVTSNPDGDTLIKTVKFYTPEAIHPLYEEYLKSTFPVLNTAFDSWLTHKLASSSYEELTLVNDCDESLAHSLYNVITKLSDKPMTYSNIADSLTTKNYTKNRITRVLTHFLLNIKNSDVKELKPYSYCLYARILGFKAESAPVLHAVKDTANVPIISKLSDAPITISNFYDTSDARKAALINLRLDTLAGNQYSLMQKEQYGTPYLHETRKNIVKL